MSEIVRMTTSQRGSLSLSTAEPYTHSGAATTVGFDWVAIGVKP